MGLWRLATLICSIFPETEVHVSSSNKTRIPEETPASVHPPRRARAESYPALQTHSDEFQSIKQPRRHSFPKSGRRGSQKGLPFLLPLSTRLKSPSATTMETTDALYDMLDKEMV